MFYILILRMKQLHTQHLFMGSVQQMSKLVIYKLQVRVSLPSVESWKCLWIHSYVLYVSQCYHKLSQYVHDHITCVGVVAVYCNREVRPKGKIPFPWTPSETIHSPISGSQPFLHRRRGPSNLAGHPWAVTSDLNAN